jgi:hypothetical protein
MAKSETSSGGISAAFALFLIFLVLKLVGLIDWSWWWVTCPLWIGFALIIAVLLVIVLIEVLSNLK